MAFSRQVVDELSLLRKEAEERTRQAEDMGRLLDLLATGSTVTEEKQHLQELREMVFVDLCENRLLFFLFHFLYIHENEENILPRQARDACRHTESAHTKDVRLRAGEPAVAAPDAGD